MFGWLLGNKYLAAGLAALAGAVVLLGWGLGHAEQRIGGLREDLKVATHDRDQAKRDLQTETTAYTALQGAHKLCMDEMRTSKEAQARAVADLATLTQRQQQESQNVRTLHESILREPGCQDLAKLDIAARCPDLAVELRQRAAYLSAAPAD